MKRALFIVLLAASCGDDTGTPVGSGGHGGGAGSSGMSGSGGTGGMSGSGGMAGSGGIAGTGGMAGTGGSGGMIVQCGLAACPQNEFCADDPRDTCNPQNGGADCPGICVNCMQPMSNLCTVGHV